jgi:PAS domain S-box-containing protein
LLGFSRRAAEHSALRGDALADLLRAAVDGLRAGTGATAVTYVEADVSGEDVLFRHEVELPAALAAAGVAPSLPVDGAARLGVEGVDDELFAFELTGADGDAESSAFAEALVEVLTSTMHRHWREVQHQERADALQQAQRHTSVGCFEWDIITNKVRWSDELFRIYGCEPQSFEPTFEEFLERIHPDDREAIRASVYQAYEERRDYRIEERIIRPDGETRLLSSWGHIITNEQTEPVKIIGSCQDVTDFRSTMAELAKREQQLADVQSRRTQALELNDNVVQGLSAAAYALQLERAAEAEAAVQATLSAARTMIDELLAGSEDGVRTAGLLRERPAAAVLPRTLRPELRRGTGPVKVVLADDSEDVRLLVGLTLAADGGFEIVAEAADGKEAVVRAEEHQPDLLLLDLAMPVLDGFDAIPLVRDVSPRTRIIVLSGLDARTGEGPAVEQGAAGFIEKGVLGPSLGEAIRAIMARSEDQPVS